MKMKKKIWIVPVILIGLVPYLLLATFILKPADSSETLRLTDCSDQQCAPQVSQIRDAITAYDASITVNELTYFHRENWYDGTSNKLEISVNTPIEHRDRVTEKLVELAWRSEVHPLEVVSITVITGDKAVDKDQRDVVFWFSQAASKDDKENPYFQRYGQRSKGQLSSQR